MVTWSPYNILTFIIPLLCYNNNIHSLKFLTFSFSFPHIKLIKTKDSNPKNTFDPPLTKFFTFFQPLIPLWKILAFLGYVSTPSTSTFIHHNLTRNENNIFLCIFLHRNVVTWKNFLCRIAKNRQTITFISFFSTFLSLSSELCETFWLNDWDGWLFS